MDTLLDIAPLWAPGTAAMGLLMFVSAFFSGSETALFYLSQDELRSFRLGKPRERVVADLLSNPDRLLTAILFWNLLVNLTYFAVSVVVAQRLARADYDATAGLFGLGSLLAIILFGEVLPKSIAVAFSRSLARLVSWPLAAAVRVLDPLLPAISLVTRVSHRTFWPHVRREPYLDVDDLERAVEVSTGSADLIQHEREILHNILDLSEITVEEMMRPRGTYVSLAPPVSLERLRGEVPPGEYVLLRGDDPDDVTAAIPLASFSAMSDENLERAAEEVVHVPWCADLAYTLGLLRGRYCSVAGVVNEYGETIGIVTLEDIIDTTLRPQPSRARRLLRREPVLEVAPGRWHVDGLTTLRYLAKRLELDYEPEGEGPFTVGGLLQEELEHIPAADDECRWNGCRIKVIEADPPGRMRVMLSRDPDEKATDER